MLGGRARFELPLALELGVELGAEQQRHVRDPQPDEEGNDATERTVGLVVRAEVRDVQAEPSRRDDPDHDGDDPAGADPAYAGLLDVAAARGADEAA